MSEPRHTEASVLALMEEFIAETADAPAELAALADPAARVQQARGLWHGCGSILSQLNQSADLQHWDHLPQAVAGRAKIEALRDELRELF